MNRDPQTREWPGPGCNPDQARRESSREHVTTILRPYGLNLDSDASRAEARRQSLRARMIRRNASRGFDAIIVRLYGAAS